MFKGNNILKLNNKSSKVAQVNKYVVASVDTGSCVKIVDTTHNQYNNDVANEQYKKDTKCQKNTRNNHILLCPIDESLVNTSFVTIGEEPIIGHCITTQDIMDIYAHGCIQDFYEEYCKLHTDKENVILAKLLSILGIEVYKDVVCYGGIYKGRYMVSNLGNVKSLYKTKHAKILKQYDNPCGYMYVYLCHNAKKQSIRVNRLVAMTFIGEPTEQLDACHSNTNSYDNRLFNLDLKTHWENLQNPITQRKLKETLKTKFDKAESTTPTTASE